MKFKSKIYRTFSINGIEIIGKDSTKNRPTDYIFTQLGAGSIIGKNVLDLGSAAGAICFESVQRGAKTATGVEYDKRKIAASKKLKKSFNISSVNFFNTNIINFLIKNDKKFEVVFLLNIVHHIHDPRLVLELVLELKPNNIVLEMPRFPFFTSYNIFKNHKKHFLYPWTISKCIKFITSHGYEINSKISNNFAFIGGQRQLIILRKSSSQKEVTVVSVNEIRETNCGVFIGPACSGKTNLTYKLNELSDISAGHFKLDSFVKSKYANSLRPHKERLKFLNLKKKNGNMYFYVNPMFKLKKYNNSLRGYRYAPKKWIDRGLKECSNIILLSSSRKNILERQMERAIIKFSRELNQSDLRHLLNCILDHNVSEKQIFKQIKESIKDKVVRKEFIKFVKYSFYPSAVFTISFLYSLEESKNILKVLKTNKR